MTDERSGSGSAHRRRASEREPGLLRKYLALLMRAPGDRWKVAILLAVMTFSAVLELLGIGLVMPFVALIQHPQIAHTSRAFRTLTRIAGVHTDTGAIMLCGVLLLTAFVAKNIYLTVAFDVQMRFGFNRMAILSRDLMRSYLAQPYTFFLQRNSSDLIRNVTTDTAMLFFNAIPALFTVIIEGLTVAVICAFLIVVEPIAVPTVAIIVGLGALAMQRMYQRRAPRASERMREADTATLRNASQAFGGVKEARLLGREDYFAREFTTSHRRYVDAVRAHRVLNALPRNMLETLGVAGLVMITIAMLLRGASTDRLVPVLGVLALGVVRVMPSMTRIVAGINDVRFNRATVDAIYGDMFATAVTPTLPVPTNQAPLAIAREIRIADVGYTYPEAKQPAIEGISLSIRKGETVAFVGSSGAGKTTLADVLVGLLTPTVGHIEIDGVVLDDDVKVRRWQRAIGYIPQHVYLCDDTLRRNIAFGIPDGAIDEARVNRALASARLGDVVRDQPRGLDTIVGERGIRLSGGQRQRIGIARALYLEPQVLILDEATSALDGVTEAEVVDAIEAVRRDRTTVVIAHRLSTVRHCDRIVFMAGGRIVQVADWDTLIATNEEFRRLANMAGYAA